MSSARSSLAKSMPIPIGSPSAPNLPDSNDGQQLEPTGKAEGRVTLHKGQQTRATILTAALNLASQVGIEGLSIGVLAEVAGMSKSGVFAHFGSREELQISVIREYHARFEQEVFRPAIRAPRGLPRLRALFEGWVHQVAAELESGCIYISGAVEFDDRPGSVRDALATMVVTWHSALKRAISMSIDCGHLVADTDPLQVLFEMHGLILSLHYDARFLRSSKAGERARRAFDRVIAYYASKEVQAAMSAAIMKG